MAKAKFACGGITFKPGLQPLCLDEQQRVADTLLNLIPTKLAHFFFAASPQLLTFSSMSTTLLFKNGNKSSTDDIQIHARMCMYTYVWEYGTD